MIEDRSQLISNIVLDGPLGERYGTHHAIAVGSAREVMDALDTRSPGFYVDLFKRAESGEFYDLVVDGIPVFGSDILAETDQGASYRFVQVPAGGIIPSIVIFGIEISLQQVIMAAVMIGLTLYQLLAKPPTPDNIEQAPGSGFDGAANLGSPGNPVALVYGEPLCGSVLVSGFLSADGKTITANAEEALAAYELDVARAKSDYQIQSNRWGQRRTAITEEQWIEAKVDSVPHRLGDTLAQRQTMRLLDLISEGPVEGFGSDTTEILNTKVFLAETPMSQFTGGNTSFHWRVGQQIQPPIDLFTGDSAVTAVGVTIHRETGFVSRAITGLPLRILVNFSINSLSYSSNTGPIAATMSYLIELSDTVGNIITRQRSILAFVLAKRSLSEEIQVPQHWVAPLTLKVKKTSSDSSSKRQSNLSWDHYVEVGANKLSYPFCALGANQYFSHEFPSKVPSRKYLMKGLLCRIPNNYNPLTRTYTSTEWDGVLNSVEQWTDNPAWVALDFATHLRYGMGIALANIDLWSLYECARRSDELVTSPGVAQEFRYTINTQIQKQRDSWTLLVEFCATMEVKPWWDGSKVRFSQDRPAEPIWQFGPENVRNGLFEYTQSSLASRHNRVSVEWRNPENFWRSDARSADDQDSIRQLGFHEKRVKPIGISFPGQASRYGHAILETEKLDSVVKFTTGSEGLPILPGSVFKISDPSKINGIGTGRLTSISFPGGGPWQVNLDHKITLTGSVTNYEFRVLSDAVEITDNQPGDTTTLTLPSNELPANDDYRLIQVQCDLDDDGDFEITRDVIGYDSGTRIVTLKSITATSSNRDYRIGYMRDEVAVPVPAANPLDTPIDSLVFSTDPDEFLGTNNQALWTMIDTTITTDTTRWKCIGMEETERHEITITAAQFDNAKFTAIDNGRAVPAGKVELAEGIIIPPPYGLILSLRSRPAGSGGIENYIAITWLEPQEDAGFNFDFAAGFRVVIRKDERVQEDIIELVEGTSIEYVISEFGTYFVEVQTVQATTGRLSDPRRASLVYSSATLPETLVRVKGLRVLNSKDNTWKGDGFEIGWTYTYEGAQEFGDVVVPDMAIGADGGLVVLERSGTAIQHDLLPIPSTNNVVSAVVILYTDRFDGLGYVERFRDSSVDGLRFSLDFEKNVAMEGGPYNAIMIGVLALDTLGRLSPEMRIFATNAAANVPSLLSVEQFGTTLRWVFQIHDDATGIVFWGQEGPTLVDPTDLREATVLHSGTNLSFSTPIKGLQEYTFIWGAYDNLQLRDADLLRGSGPVLRSSPFTMTTTSFDLGQAAIDGIAIEDGTIVPQHVRSWLSGGSGEVLPTSPAKGDFFLLIVRDADGEITSSINRRYDGTTPYDESGWKVVAGGQNNIPDEIIVNDNVLARTIFTEKLVVGDFFNHAQDHNFDLQAAEGFGVDVLWEKAGGGGDWLNIIDDHPSPHSGVGNFEITHSLVVPFDVSAYQGFNTSLAGKSYYGITASEGDEYNLAFRIRTENTEGTPTYDRDTVMFALIIFTKSDDTVVITEQAVGLRGNDDDWAVICSVDAVAPADTVRVRLGFRVDRTEGDGDDWTTATTYIDDLQFRKKTGTAFIEDLAVTNAKIQDVSAGKITAGIINVLVNLGVGGNIDIDGVNDVFLIRDDASTLRVRIGKKP